MRNKYFKKIALFTVTGSIVLGLGSCKKFLSPETPSLLTTTDVYSNVYTAGMAVLGIYQDLAGDQGYGIRLSMYYSLDNDETIASAKAGDNDRGDIAHYNASSINLQLYSPYVQLYQGIERANLCIYNIQRMPLFKSGSGKDYNELQRLYGEALTLRAQFYLELIRNWGDVPAQFLPSEVSKNLFIGKTDRNVIYDTLLNSLLTAESMVPWRSQVTALTDDAPDERITKGAVKALRAKIALYRGGYDLRKDLTISRDEAHYKDYYQIAWNECNDIINSGEHKLNPSFKSLFKNGICAHTTDPYNEIIFQVAMGGGTGSTDSKIGLYNGPKFGGTITSVLPNATGVPTPTITYSSGSASLLMLPTYFYLFDANDLRRDVTIAPYDVMQDYSKVGSKITALRDGKFRADWVSNPAPSSSLYWGLDWPLIRYADVLLMFAEADNELNNGVATGSAAYNAFAAVRTRGFGGNAALIGTIPTDKDGFFKAIVRERSLEFGGEGVRKYDLKRWGLLGTAISETQKNINTLGYNLVMATTSYMASPPSYTISGPLPSSMFFNYPGDAGNPGQQATAVDDSTLWVSGSNFYGKKLGITVTQTYARPINTKVGWVAGPSTSTPIPPIVSTFSILGSGFKPNHSELFPLPQIVIDASNKTLTQDYGY